MSPDFKKFAETLEFWQTLADYFNDEAEIRRRYWKPSRGQTVIDVGSAEGSYTVPALLHDAAVYAFDPNYYATQALRYLVTGVLASARKIAFEAYVMALGDGTRTIPEGLRLEWEAQNPHMVPPFTYEWSTLDEQVKARKIRFMDWLKIDVEGMEFDVLFGGRKSIARLRPRILIEDHTIVYPWVQRNGVRGQIEELLATMHYRHTLVRHEGGIGGGPRDYIIAVPK